ncbi:MAG TPA: GNAT family N-acetyltransferase [Brevibacterium senegalense]|uniref:GNAT family N-acetyltransferase n=1 Tax=Brevibacterium senegalense TaxID=1033736 RepID=A0A921MH23_9MICO|nr:GNAT family N-acetyltransferase [Brevibacterium senegalense]
MLDARLLPLRNDLARLREMRLDDAHAYAAGAADAQVRTYAHLPEPEYTEASVTALISGEIRDGLRRGDLAVLTIADPDTDAFAGSLVLFGPADGAIEVGFWVHSAHRGRGRARAAVALAVEFARRCGFERVTARTVPDNHASRRVLEQAGFDGGAEERDVAPSGREAVLLHYTWDCAAAGPAPR